MNSWGITHQGAVREQNQDAYQIRVLTDDGLVAVVCDGMGGAKAGQIASSLATVTFMDKLLEVPLQNDESLRWRVEEAASEANALVFNRSLEDADCTGMGTTLVSAVVTNSYAHILNIGDSRCYLIHEGAIRRITRDHSLVEDLMLRGELTSEEARSHPHKNLITRALGTEPTLRADCYDVTLAQGDILLLCSDGLSNVLTDEELCAPFTSQTLEQGGQSLLDLALERKASDNVTVVLIAHQTEGRV